MIESQQFVPDAQLVDWLLNASELGASDLHIVPGYAPTIRLHGVLQPLAVEILSAERTEELLCSICSKDRIVQFRRRRNLDFAPVVNTQSRGVHWYVDAGTSTDATVLQRFRANYFLTGNQMAGCFRVIPGQIPDFQWAGFSSELADRLGKIRNGLVLFTGVTGSGKSTSLAMMIRKLIDEGGRRIITIEEPIEYVFSQKDGSLVTQREVGQDVDSFSDGLKYGLRQDPDVMLVGEIRDRETAQIALSAAETGHLIFATLHTRDAKGAVNRFTDLFPQNNQNEIRSQLALSLRAVISQHLLPSSVVGEKRELAVEILFNTSPMSAAIRMGKIESIDTNIQTGRADGMRTMDESIRRLMQDGRITRETALEYVVDPTHLDR